MRPAVLLTAFAVLAASAGDVLSQESDVERYCTAVRDDARERRYALIDAQLASLREEVERESIALEDRTTELREWVERRETFLALADDALVAIYAAMRPDTAGEQIALLEPVIGAAIVMRLKPRQAGGVLAAMPAETAATLASIIAASSHRTEAAR